MSYQRGWIDDFGNNVPYRTEKDLLVMPRPKRVSRTQRSRRVRCRVLEFAQLRTTVSGGGRGGQTHVQPPQQIL